MLNIRKLSPALAKKAVEELNEDPERSASAVEILRDWITKQKHLKARTDDQFLISILRGCKFSVERAKHKIDLIYTVRTALPCWFKDRQCDGPKMMEVIKSGAYFFIPSQPETDLPAVFVFRPGFIDPNKIDLNDILRLFTSVMDLKFLEDDNFAVCGIHVFTDCHGLSIHHLLQYDLITMKKVSVYYQDAAPFRIKGFHYFNMAPIVEPVFNLFKSVLNEKIRNRIYLYGKDIEGLQKISNHFPLDLLPNEYGGKAGTTESFIEQCAKKILSSKEILEGEEKYGVIEELRPKDYKYAENLFGVDGTFRKLNID